jgi:hypothetical protein
MRRIVLCSGESGQLSSMDTLFSTPARPRGSTVRWIAALLIGILVGVAGIGVLSRQSQTSFWNRMLGSLLGRSTSIDVSQPTVVNKIQQLQRLETVVYTMDKVVSGEKESAILPDFLAGDKLLMIVHGQVVAGVDFSGLKTGDVSVNGKNVRLRLPPPQVFLSRLDNARTRVYSRQTGLLVPVDPNLETQVRQEAERQLQQAALADGVLKTAQQNAQSTLTSLLQGLGFASVEFE